MSDPGRARAEPGRPAGLLLDLAGVVYQGDALLPGAPAAIGRLRAAGIPFRFVTNTSRRSRRRLVEALRARGLQLEARDVFTAPLAARARLEAMGVAPHLLVHPELVEDFEGLAGGRPGAVVVGDAAGGFTYAALNEAFRLLMDGAPLLAVGRNRYFREDDGLSLDAGPFVAALEYAAGVQAEITGKPAPGFFHRAVADMGLDPGKVLMVGDDVEADVAGALDAGLAAVLVKTGKYRRGDEDRIGSRGARVCADLSAAISSLNLE